MADPHQSTRPNSPYSCAALLPNVCTAQMSYISCHSQFWNNRSDRSPSTFAPGFAYSRACAAAISILSFLFTTFLDCEKLLLDISPSPLSIYIDVWSSGHPLLHHSRYSRTSSTRQDNTRQIRANTSASIFPSVPPHHLSITSNRVLTKRANAPLVICLSSSSSFNFTCT